MDKIKTVPSNASVATFLDSISDTKRQADSWELIKIMQSVTGEKPVMWGPAIIGFGSVHYKYTSGREGDMPIVSFSPRKNALTIYNLIFYERNLDLADKLGPHARGKGCLYVKDLHALDLTVLKQMIRKTMSEPNLFSNT